jgi:cyclophilin family peptidyl-prolyl cis-trans isomerase
MRKANAVLTIFVFILLTAFNTMTNAQTIVVFQTTSGDIKISLYPETVAHSENMIKLVKEKYYDGILFHRVIQGFMIQTGDPNSRIASTGQTLGDGGPDYTIQAEFFPQYYHKKGAVAAARLGDQINPEKQSSGSQFYIVQGQVLTNGQLDALEKSTRRLPFTVEQRQAYTTMGGTPHLDNNYTVFGEVIEGLEVVDAIAAVNTDQRNRPVNNIIIITAYIQE